MLENLLGVLETLVQFIVDAILFEKGKLERLKLTLLVDVRYCSHVRTENQLNVVLEEVYLEKCKKSVNMAK